MYQSKQMIEQNTVASPAPTPGKHSACETIQVIELSAAGPYLGPGDWSLQRFMAYPVIAGSVSCCMKALGAEGPRGG